jgi:hypothetical protein
MSACRTNLEVHLTEEELLSVAKGNSSPIRESSQGMYGQFFDGFYSDDVGYPYLAACVNPFTPGSEERIVKCCEP